jgi:hypothetical protein
MRLRQVQESHGYFYAAVVTLPEEERRRYRVVRIVTLPPVLADLLRRGDVVEVPAALCDGPLYTYEELQTGVWHGEYPGRH